DTEYAFYGGTPMSVAEILAAIEPHHCNLVEITGGEPLLQPDVPELASELLKRNHRVLVETGGALDISVLPSDVIKIMDLKCPDSGMSEQMDWKNLERLSPADEIKFVINSRADYDWAVDVLKLRRLSERNHVLFSPVYRSLPPEQLAEWILGDDLPVRLQIQLHKVLWGEAPGR
ncbi:MAG TPA: radical SAM protein, partial [Acidobacteriota bacterium]|nr:radical SAM protein [Acidobacteriota bacterium]